MRVCPYCHEKYDDEETFFPVDGLEGEVCESCYENCFTQCANCESVYSQDHHWLYDEQNHQYLCETCQEDLPDVSHEIVRRNNRRFV